MVAPVNRPRRSRLRGFARVGVIIVGAVFALVFTLAVVAGIVIQEERFGRMVTWALPATRGRISVGGGTWSWGGILALARGSPAPLDLTDVRIVDPEGTEVLRV